MVSSPTTRHSQTPELSDKEIESLSVAAESFARRLLSNRSIRGLSWEDFAADALCEIVSRNDEGVRTKGFARKIVHSRYVDQVRKQAAANKYLEKHSLDSTISLEDGTLETIEIEDDLALLKKAIGLLSDEQEDLLHRRFTRNQTTAEIASEFGVGRRWIQLRLRNVMNILKSMMC